MPSGRLPTSPKLSKRVAFLSLGAEIRQLRLSNDIAKVIYIASFAHVLVFR
jgi:hypothetical protein